jgi:hypothetical protein
MDEKSIPEKRGELVIGYWILDIDYLNSQKLALLPITNIQ